MDRIEALKSVVVDLLPEIAEWNRRNFPESGHAHKAYGVVEETGELFHAILKGLQGIRHSPEEIKAMIADAFADIGVYTLAFAADVMAGLPGGSALDGVYFAEIVDEEGEACEGDEYRRPDEPLGPRENAAVAATLIVDAAARVSRVSREIIEANAADLLTRSKVASALNHAAALLVGLDCIGWECYGLDFPALLRETWAKVVAKRDWRADPMGAAEVAG